MRRKPWSAAGVIVGAVLFASVAAAPAPAVTASGCSGKAASTTKDGAALHEVSGPGPGGTRSDPFRVDRDGTVTWSGETTQVIRNGKWTVKAWPTSISDRIGNDSGLTTKSGVDKVSDRLPVKMPGLFFVKVTLTGGDGASCVASGWVKIAGSPAFTPLWFGALIPMLLGLAGWASLMRRLLRGGSRMANKMGTS